MKGRKMKAKEIIEKPITEHPDVQRLIVQMTKLQAENKTMKEALKSFVKNVKENTHNMSFEKMHPTLKMHFNHLVSCIKWPEQALLAVSALALRL